MSTRVDPRPTLYTMGAGVGRIVGVLTALGALVAAAPASADLGVDEPAVSIETSTSYSPESDSAIAPDGTVVFAYNDDDGIDDDGVLRLLQLAPDGTRNEVVLAEGSPYFQPSVVVDDTGTATVAWREADEVFETPDSLRFARISPAGIVTSDGVVGVVGVGITNEAPVMGVGPNGIVTVVWQQIQDIEEHEDKLLAARIEPDGQISQRTSFGIQHHFIGPAVAVDSEGDAVILRAWVPGERGRCQVNALQADGTVVRGPAFNCAYEAGRLAIAGDGTVTAVTRKFGRRTRARVLQFADDTLRLRSRAMTESTISLPEVAVNPITQRPRLVWTDYISKQGSGIVTARLTRDGSIGRVSILARHTRGPKLTFDPQGRAVVMWRQLDGVRLGKGARVDADIEGPPPTEDRTQFIQELLMGPDSRPVVMYRETTNAADGTGSQFFVRLAYGTGDWAARR